MADLKLNSASGKVVLQLLQQTVCSQVVVYYDPAFFTGLKKEGTRPTTADWIYSIAKVVEQKIGL
jgi:hypothetical protein